MGAYKNYLTMNGHKPILRHHFKEFFFQRDFWLKQEKSDMEKLEMALQYLKELNHIKYSELEETEKLIKQKLDEKANINEMYKQHLGSV